MFNVLIISVGSTRFIQPKIDTRFYVFLRLSNIKESQYTQSTDDLDCRRPEDDLMSGRNM
jgi:hypothetical protein